MVTSDEHVSRAGAPRLPDGVGWTALMTAYARADETRGPTPLFEDPWAAAVIARATGTAVDATDLPRLGPARASASAPSGLWGSLGTYFTVRTPFFDSQVLQGVEDGVDQVVVLAAGFDGRAQRLGLPAGTRFFELDTDPVLSFKDDALVDAPPATADRRVVRVDLREDWPAALADAGFDSSQPAVWVVEGLLMYLEPEEADLLLTRVGGLAAPGSRLAAEWFERNPVGEDALVGWPDEQDRRAGEMVGSLFAAGPPAPPREWLEAHGWQVVEVDDVAGYAVRHSRAVPWMFDPTDPRGLRVHLAAGRRPSGHEEAGGLHR